MLASELANKLRELITNHGDCPVFLAEEGNEYPAQSIKAIKQAPVPSGCQGTVEAGKVYFFLE